MDIFLSVIIAGAVASVAYVFLAKHVALTNKAAAEVKLIEAQIKREEQHLLESVEYYAANVKSQAESETTRFLNKLKTLSIASTVADDIRAKVLQGEQAVAAEIKQIL